MADQPRQPIGGREPESARRRTDPSPSFSLGTGQTPPSVRWLALLGLLAVGLLAGCSEETTIDDEVRRAAEFRAAEPLLAEEAIGPEDLPGWLLEEADHYSPAEDFDFTDSTLSAAVVALGSLDYVERELSRSDPELYLHVRLTRHPTVSNADSAWDGIELDPELVVADRPVRTFEITETGVAGDFERLVAVTSDGPVSVLMELVNSRPDRDPDFDIRAEMARLLELQLDALTPRRQFTGTVDFRFLRRSFLRNLGDAVSFLPYIVILMVNIRDPASRDRLRRRSSRFVDLDDPMTTDVTSGAEYRRRRRRGDALVLTGVLGVLVFAILATPFGISGPPGTQLLAILPTLLLVELGRRFYASRRPVGGLTSTVHLDQVEGSNRMARLFGVVFSVPLLLLGLSLIYLALFLHDRWDGLLVATASVPGGPTTLAAWGELTLVASANADTLVAIDPAGEVVERFNVPPTPSALWVAGDIAYIASSFDDSVARLDLLAGHIDWVTAVPDVDHRLVVGGDTVAVLVKRDDANVVLLDAATGELEREFGYGVRLTSLALIGESTFVGLSPVGVIVDDLSEAS